MIVGGDSRAQGTKDKEVLAPAPGNFDILTCVLFSSFCVKR
jgi:hypothetical protein